MRAFTKQEWANGLLGCFEVFLFMPKGIERFDTSAPTAVKSFLIPLVLSPVLLAVLAAFSSGFSFTYLMTLHSVRVLITSLLFLGVVYLMIRQYGREEHFMRFVTVNNWMTIPSTLFLLPVVVCLVMGMDHSVYESYALFVTLAGYVYTGFIISKSFKLPWEMGAFISIMGLAIDQHALDLTRNLQQFMG